MCQSAAQAAVYPASAGPTNFGQYSTFSLFSAGLDILLRLVEQQRQRKALARLDEHLLCDIGLSAADARYAASRPFWQ